MAVKINLKDGTGSKTAYFKQEKTPATQGNVINTLDAYNEKIKKEYYDKNQARADENALQESIQKIVELLAKDTSFKSKTKSANTKSKDTEEDRLEGYLGEFDEDKKLAFDEAGLVRKINVIANILSGNTENSKQWAADVHGNNAGSEESTLNVPVIGITRKDPEYTAEFKTKNKERVLEISGLNDIKIERPNGQEDTINASEITVLSEKQVALMISSSIKHVLGGFDSQIANITAYLLFQEGELPDSYEYVLRNTNDEGIKSAPLFITYEDSDSNISSTDTQALPAYYIHDLNGDIGNIESADYIINESNIGSLISDSGWTPTNSLFTLKADKNLEKINVHYKNSEAPIYSLSVPKKTLTLNLHGHAPAEGTSISYSCKVFDNEIRTGDFVFNNGIASENFPQGSTVIITKPTDFVDMLFCKENYDKDTEVTSINLSKEDAHVYNKKLTFIYKDKETGTLTGYYSDSFLLTKRLSYPGYEATETVFGVDSIQDKWLKITKEKIKEKISDNTDEFTFDCNITWKNRQVTVSRTYLDKGEQKEETTTLATGQEIPSITVEGYDFKGWQDSEGKVYTTVPFEDIDTLKLFAVQVLKTYNFIYDLNGGKWNSVGYRSTHSYVFTATDSDLIPTDVSRPGYTFEGWYTRPELENDIYHVEHFVNEDCTLYAKWEEKSYTIEFELNSHKQLEVGANPMFKYQSLTVKASNLPITLGQAYATGYEFKGWAKTVELSLEANEANNLESYAGISQIEISDFDTNDTINLSAVWNAIAVPVIEEYYYEVDGQTGKYDLLETSKKSATVGTIYEKATYSPNVGFEEKERSEFTVMPTGNVYKRYFDRASFTVTYSGVGPEAEPVSYKYSDNAQELKSVDEKLFDCWLKVETDENGKVISKTPIKQISAYHFSPLTLEARYNQNAPVLGTDFTVTTTFYTITISTVSASGKILVNKGEGDPTEITDSRPVVFNYSDIYSSGVNTTKSCFVYFAGNEDTNQNPSDQVEVPLIYNNDQPVSGKDYVLESATSTVKKLKDGLEYRIGSSTKYLDLTSDLTIGRTDTIYIRKKETFSRFASDEVSGSFTGKAKASTDALIRTNFTVEDVSYKEQGHIEIAAAVFQGNHGALQYQTGSGNAWLDVNRTEIDTSPTTLYVDKPCTVSFRYNDSDEYLASSTTVEVPVGIKTHTVTFDTSDINYSTYNFEGLDKVEGLNKFTLTAPSGSQLCKVENYIKNVNNWTITGYTKNIDSNLGRAVSFLKKEDGSQYNEASIIDDDITLRMNWAAAKFDVTYTDAVILGDRTELSLPSELLEKYKKTFYYGQDVEIDLINNLTSLANYESTLVSILNNIDKETDKILSFKHLYYKTGNLAYVDTGAEVTKNDATWKFDYFGKNGTPNFGETLESFPYKFASKFDFVGITAENAVNAQIQFYNGIDSGTAIGTVKEVSYYGGKGFSNFKFVSGSDNNLNIYYAGDPRATSYNTIDSFIATESSVGNGCTLTVTFHSAYIGGTFYPRKVVEGVIAIRSTVTDQNQIYNISVDGDGSTLVTPINDWTIEASPVYNTTNSN